MKLESEQKEGEVAVRGYLQEFQYGKEMVQTTTDNDLCRRLKIAESCLAMVT